MFTTIIVNFAYIILLHLLQLLLLLQFIRRKDNMKGYLEILWFLYWHHLFYSYHTSTYHYIHVVLLVL